MPYHTGYIYMVSPQYATLDVSYNYQSQKKLYHTGCIYMVSILYVSLDVF